MKKCLISGGNWNNGSNAGVWNINWNNARNNSNDNVGGRSDLDSNDLKLKKVDQRDIISSVKQNMLYNSFSSKLLKVKLFL